MSDLLLGGGLPPPTPSALNPVPAERPENAQNACACRGKRLDRGLKTLKTRTPRGYYFGGLQPFSPCLSMKRASRNAPQANKPMMAFSPTCRWKGHFERFRRRWGSKHFMKALGSLSERASLGPSSPVPRLAGGKANRRHPTIAFSSTGRGKRESQAHGHIPMIALSSTGREKRNRKRMPMFP